MSSCKDQAQEANSDYLILLPPTLPSYFWGEDTALDVVIGKVICSKLHSLSLLGNYILLSRNPLTHLYGCTRCD